MPVMVLMFLRCFNSSPVNDLIVEMSHFSDTIM